jgi:general secretion pathway protein K
MLVLWLIVVLAAIAVTVVAAAREEVNTVSNLRARVVARYAAESGVVAARLALSQAFSEATTPEEQILAFPRVRDEFADLMEQPLGPARFQVALVDLSARIDLNQADQTMLQNFLRQFVGQSEAEELAQSLIDYRDQDAIPFPRGGEAEQYAERGSPFVPANRPLQTLEELLRVQGFTDAVADEIAPYVTVRGDRRINVNAAQEPVLAALPGVGQAGADAIVSRRHGAGAITSLVQLGTIPGLGGGGNPQQRAIQLPIVLIPTRVLIISRGWQPGHPLSHEIQVVLEISGLRSGTAPTLIVRHWTERDL